MRKGKVHLPRSTQRTLRKPFVFLRALCVLRGDIFYFWAKQ